MNQGKRDETFGTHLKTHRPARIRVENKPQIQVGLVFAGTVNIIDQQNQQFHHRQWKIMNLRCKELYGKYLKAYPLDSIYGRNIQGLPKNRKNLANTCTIPQRLKKFI